MNDLTNNYINEARNSVKIFIEIVPVVIAFISLLGFVISYLITPSNVQSRIEFNIFIYTAIPVFVVISVLIIMATFVFSISYLIKNITLLKIILVASSIITLLTLDLGMIFISWFVGPNLLIYIAYTVETVTLLYLIILLNRLYSTNLSVMLVLILALLFTLELIIVPLLFYHTLYIGAIGPAVSNALSATANAQK